MTLRPTRNSSTVAVTGLGSSDNPSPGVGVIRCLRSDPFFDGRIVGLAYDAMDAGIFDSELADSVYLLPYPSQGKDQLAARLDSIAATEKIDVVIPTLDSEMPAMVDLAARPDELSFRTFLPTRSQLAAREKPRIKDLADACGILTPRTMIVSDTSDLRGAIDAVGLPALVKGLYYDAVRCHSLNEVHEAFYKVSASWGLPVIVQESLDGEEYDTAILGDGEGGLMGAVTMKKMVVNGKGKAWAGVTVVDSSLLDAASRLVAELKWRGPAEIEFIRSSLDGKLRLIEMNPRFPAWIYLCAASGQNLPSMCVRMACGEKVAHRVSHEAGKMFVRVASDIIADIRDLEAMATWGQLSRHG